MSWQNFLALAVFVIVCGFIAYWGDLLGRRMGKRRLTLFGMRPRYTAIMTTTVTGMLIAVFTILVMTTASKQIRTLALRGHVILREYRAAQEALAAATKEIEKQMRIAAEARKEAEEVLHQRRALAAEIERLTTDLDKLRADLKRNEAELGRTEKQLGSANEEVKARKAEIAEQKDEIKSLEAQRARIAGLYIQDMEAATLAYSTMRQTPVIFRPNQEIARGVIRCAQSKMEIRADLLALLGQADKRARDEGAKVGDNSRAVEILPKRIVDGAGKARFLKESESIDALVDNIYSGSGSVLVLTVSVGNSIEGEQALIEFMLTYNRLVYASGDEVASGMIDGGAPRGQIFGNLVAFLRNEVRSAAIGKGVVPAYDQGGQPSVGQMAWDQLFDLVDKVSAVGKPVRVTAYAAEETWSAGPLDLDLVVGDSR